MESRRTVRRILRVVVVAVVALGAAVAAVVAWLDARLDDNLPDGLARSLDSRYEVVAPLTLVVGVDRAVDEEDPGRADAILLVRRPDERLDRPAVLSIPRNLRDPADGEELGRLYSSDSGAFGEAVAELVGSRVLDVVLVNFDGMPDLVDALGGVSVDNPTPLASRFDGRRWSFDSGQLNLNGTRARAFVRARENDLASGPDDADRHARQHLLLRALGQRATSVSGLVRLPQALPRLDDALQTTHSPRELWRLASLLRDDDVLYCRLGGEWKTVGVRPPTTQRAARNPPSLIEQLDSQRLVPSPRNGAVVRAILAGAEPPPLDHADEPAGCS